MGNQVFPRPLPKIFCNYNNNYKVPVDIEKFLKNYRNKYIYEEVSNYKN